MSRNQLYFNGYLSHFLRLLTPNIDHFMGTQFNDTFDASQPNTLQSFDSLDGAGGVDTLYTVLDNVNVTPAKLANIEVFNVTANTASTLNLQNAGQVTNVNNNASASALTFSNIAAGAALGVSNTGSDTTFAYANTAGTQSVNLSVDGVTGGADVVIAGVETINTTASGNASSINLVAAAANTLNFAGNANLTVADLNAAGTNIVSSINASTMTGNLNITTGDQTPALSAHVTIQGGFGNDTINVTGLTPAYTVTLGAGNDTVVDTGVTTADTITGGLGEDTLSTTAANAATLSAATPTTYNITGMDQLTLSTVLAGENVKTQNIDTSIDTVNIAGGTGTLTLGAGSQFVNLNGALAGGALTLVDTGTAITDTVTIADADNANVNIFGGQNITSNGFENVVIDVSNGVWTDKQQTIGTLKVTADAATAPVSVTLTGDNDIAITAFETDSTGLTTINASAIAAGNDVLYFSLAGTKLGTGGTQSITGTAGVDNITVGNFASTIVAGAGDDVVNGGTAADSIDGGLGNDVLDGKGGNDTIHGGAGNDTISALVAGTVSITGGEGDDLVNVGTTISAGDILDGGAGTNTLEVDQQIIAAYAGATNFSTLRLDGNARVQNVALYTNLKINVVELTDTVTAHDSNVSGLADGTLVKIRSDADHTLSLLTDTSSNTLSIGAYGAADRVFGSVIVDNTNTLNIVQADQDALHVTEVGHLISAQVTQINITGHQLQTSVDHVDFGAGARSITVDATAADGNGDFRGITVYFDGTDALAGQNLTMLGSLTKSNLLIGGAGNDAITGGAAADSLLGGAGNDTINAGTGTVEDTVGGGLGIDTITLNVDGAADHIEVSVGDSVVISAISPGVIAAGSTLTFAAGVDVINNFLAGSGATADHIHNIGGQDSTLLTSLIGATGATVTDVDTTEYYLSGSYNGLTGVFTVAANGAGADTLVINGVTGDTLASSLQSTILIGVNSANLTTDNFVA